MAPARAGWNTFSPDCYKNSAAVSVPLRAICQLANLKLSGTAVASGTDTLVFTTETEAYSTTGKDSVVDLATAWKESEFNIIGDGGGSEAVFNKGASMTVKIAVTDGSTAAPACTANAGTTGETNNLTLKSCTTSSGSTPSTQFVESDGALAVRRPATKGGAEGILRGATGQNRNFLYYQRPCRGSEFPQARFDPEAPPAAGLFDFATRDDVFRSFLREARWQSGHAAACKAVYAGSIPTVELCVARSLESFLVDGSVAEWSCNGLQSRLRRFDSAPNLGPFPPRFFRFV
jgi:hypothetical protein